MCNYRNQEAAEWKRQVSMIVPLLAIVALSAAGCQRVGQMKAMQAFKSANQAYQAQDYKKAASLYEDTVEANPDMAQAYFFLGNSYDNLYKPGKKGDPQNDAYMEKAVQNYQKAAEKLNSGKPEDQNLRKLSLQYLVASYGSDKMNDPARAEPVVQRMIQLDPGDPTNYFALAKIYEDAALYDQAERILIMARDVKPNDPAVYMQLAGFYKGMDDFDKTIQAVQQRAEKEPNNPEAYYTIAQYYWDEAYRNNRLKESDKRDDIQKGLQAIDKAIQIKPDYIEALVYKNLLLRLEANLEKDASKQQALLKEADQLRDKAQQLQKQKTASE